MQILNPFLENLEYAVPIDIDDAVLESHRTAARFPVETPTARSRRESPQRA